MPDEETVTVAGREIKISNPSKVFFPAVGVTKWDLVQYYITVAEGALRGVYHRPTVLKRYPDGVDGEMFFQKRVPKGRPDWVETVVVSFPSGRSAEELCPADTAHVVYAANLGCLDLNPWAVRSADIDHPDELRVDLDPMPGVTWDAVRQVALEVIALLGEMGLPAFPKTS
ncbi:MAG: ATP-dependent DNA ligase, partial [Acidimicrobiales bacterium]